MIAAPLGHRIEGRRRHALRHQITARLTVLIDFAAWRDLVGAQRCPGVNQDAHLLQRVAQRIGRKVEEGRAAEIG